MLRRLKCSKNEVVPPEEGKKKKGYMRSMQ
jgi:hypothetical protein